MPTISQIKTTWDNNIRKQTSPQSVSRTNVAGDLDLIAGELQARGIKIVADLDSLQAESGADGTIILVKETGFFQKANTATGINYPASGGGYWIQKATFAPADLSNYYTKTQTDSALSNKVSTSQRNAPNGVVGLTASSKIDPVYLPTIAINKIIVVADEAERLALTDVNPGDAVKETETVGTPTYMLAQLPASADSNWVEISDISGSWDSISGKPSEFDAGSLKGKSISSTAPTNGQVLTYDASSNSYKPEDAAVSTNVQGTLTDAATTNWDFSAFNIAVWVAEGNNTLDILNPVTNKGGLLYLYQDEIGGRVINLPGLKPTGLQFSTNPGALDILGFFYDGTNFVWSIANYGTVNDSPALTAPSLTATPISSSQINLSVASVPNASTYKFERADNSAFTTGVTMLQNTSSTSCPDTGLPASTTKYYRCTALASGYLEGVSSIVSAATPASTQLAAPGSFAANPVSDTQINLSWASVTNATGYVVDRATNAGFTTGVTLGIYSGNGLSFNDTSRIASTQYFYRIRATASGFTDSIYSTTNATTNSSAVLEDLSFSTQSALSSTGTVWTSTDASGLYKGYGLCSKKLAASNDGYIQMKYTAIDAKNIILAFNISQENVQYQTPPGTPPGNYEAAFMFSSGALYYIDNGANPVAAGYTLTVGDYARINRTGSTLKLQTSSNGTTWTDRYTYTFSSAAELFINMNIDTNTGVNKLYDPKGFNLVAATTQLAVPGSFTAMAASDTQINLTWNSVVNATSYVVDRATNSGFTTGVVLSIYNSTGTSFGDTGRVASTQYFYRIRAIGSGFADSNYSTTNATTTSSGAVLEDLSFSPQVGLSNTGTVWTSTDSTNLYKGYGLATKKLAAGSDGYLQTKYTATDAKNVILAFNTTKENVQYQTPPGSGTVNYEAAIMLYNGILYYMDNGGAATTSGYTLTIGDYVRISRTGSTLKLQTSSNGTTWTDRYTFTFSSTADLFINTNIDTLTFATAKLYDPKGFNLVTA
ncbi:hypothetical protein QEG73_21990 [Chitinophagaceae bacterium 26-R-25]|nr:hypothetical protein [Chitinophagaceae bacterium 26-R-25]